MSSLYLDSSALVKRYLTETGSKWIDAVTDPQAGNTSSPPTTTYLPPPKPKGCRPTTRTCIRRIRLREDPCTPPSIVGTMERTLRPFVMQLLFFALGLTILLPAHPAHAQSGRTYTIADGLPSNNIQALAYQEDPLDFPPCNSPECTEPPVIPGPCVGTDRGLTYLNGREAVTIGAENGVMPSSTLHALLPM